MVEKFEEVVEFVERFREFGQEQFSGFNEQFLALKLGFEVVRDNVIAEAREFAPGFNVFSILGMERYEERTQSAMLAHLLWPRGSHGQQFLFLNNFLAMMQDAHPDFPMSEIELEEGDWHVRTEVSIGNGRLDIVVHSPDLNCLYVIENKVDAFEQVDQLQRYAVWMKTQAEEYPTQALIFLTISGYDARTADGVDYFPISYHSHIAEWLERTLPEIQAPAVREIVKQYKDLVSSL